MKKATWLFSSVIAALLATGAPAVVSAESGPGTSDSNLSTGTTDGFTLATDTEVATAESVAEVNIQPGNLFLKAVPNLNFGEKEVKGLITNGLDFSLTKGTIQTGAAAYDGNSSNSIEVDDFRGTNAGWTLNAKISGFTKLGDNSASLSATEFTLTGAVKTDTLDENLTGSNIATGETSILTAAEGKGSGIVQSTLEDAKLSFAKTPNAVAGTYQATVTWTLSAVPGA